MILDKLFGRASLEDPSVSLGSYYGLKDTMMESDSGISVNGQTALTNSAVWAAYNVISSGLAKLPINVHRKVGDEKEIFTNHAAQRLLHRRPNEYMTPYNCKQVLQGRALIYGTAFAEIKRDQNAQPSQITPLDPRQTNLIMVGDDLFVVTRVDGRQYRIPSTNCLIIRGPSDNGLLGHAIATLHKDTIGLGMALKKYSNRFFKNNGRPSLVLKHPGHLDEEDAKRLRESWEKLYGGMDNAARTAVLEEGMEVQTMGLTPEEGLVIDSLNWTVADVARIFNVQPSKLAELSNNTLRTVPEANRQFLDDTLDPWLTLWEEECNAKLLTERQKDGSVYVKFNRKKLLAMNTVDRYQAHEIGIRAGFLLRSEVRDIEDMNPVDGIDEPLISANLKLVSEAEEDVEETEEPEPLPMTASQRELLEQTARRMVKRVGLASTKAANNGCNFIEWLDGPFRTQHQLLVFDALSGPITVLAELRELDGAEHTKRITDQLFEVCYDQLLAAAGSCNRDTFSDQVDYLTATWLKALPGQLADSLFGGMSNGSD